MTPRTLLTTIGGTAIAFAMAIIVAASTVPGTATQRDETVTPAMYAVQTSRDTSVERMRMASWDEPCLFAL
jgi:hypothetical protein